MTKDISEYVEYPDSVEVEATAISTIVRQSRKRIYVLAINYEEALNFANLNELDDWYYCSYIEQIYGIKNAEVYLVPGWRDRRNVKAWMDQFMTRRFSLIAQPGDNIILDYMTPECREFKLKGELKEK